MGFLRGGLDGAQNALVLGSPTDPAAVEVCMDLLAHDDPDRLHVLSVLFTARPDKRRAEWEHHVGQLPARFDVLCSQQPSATPDGYDVRQVSGPGNFTGIGVSITELLSAWPEDAPGSVCLHSATALLQHGTTDQVYQFLYTLCDHLGESGVHGHVHLNPGAHDQRTVDTLMTLFDAVVEVDGKETTVKTR
ncbi:MAG TPA: hypothetical protein VKA37_13390 [Halobacteriales archaeon]|nr:hypothetical protein [Halobacteriales archaeon]